MSAAASGTSPAAAVIALATRSELVDAVLMSNQTSQPRRVTVTAVAAAAAGWRRQAVHEVTPKLTSSRRSKPTQVALQWVVTYRSGSRAASPSVHGTMATHAARVNPANQAPRRSLIVS
jgi:hypothetical protein